MSTPLVKNVKWYPAAIESLNSTFDYILENWSENEADTFLDSIDHAIEVLKSHPLGGPQLEGSTNRRILVDKNSSLIYKFSNNTIHLLIVWDHRQDPDDLFKQITVANNELS